MSQSTQPAQGGASLASIQREYLEDLKCRVSPCHYTNVKARLERLAEALQLGDLHQLQPLQVIRYRNQQREKGASNRTANLVVDSFGAMLAWAVGCGLIPTNPPNATGLARSGSLATRSQTSVSASWKPAIASCAAALRGATYIGALGSAAPCSCWAARGAASEPLSAAAEWGRGWVRAGGCGRVDGVARMG